MATRTSTENAWNERQILKQELAAAREELYSGSQLLRSSVSVGARAKAFVMSRPAAVIGTTLAVGATLAVGGMVVRLLPAVLWRTKGGLLARFTAELAKGAAGVALPFLLNRLSRFHSRPVRGLLPDTDHLSISPNPQTNPNPNTYMTTLQLKGNWHQIKGNLKQKYAQLTDDDLLYVEGKEEELLGRLQERTGETREALSDLMKKL